MLEQRVSEIQKELTNLTDSERDKRAQFNKSKQD
jgi:hypothetical protein